MDEFTSAAPKAELPPTAPNGHAGLARAVIFFGVLGVTGTAAWLYLRRQQRNADEQTRDRLAPRP